MPSWNPFTDDLGSGVTDGKAKHYSFYTDEYLESIQPKPEPLPEPTENEMMMDYLVDVDYRVTMIELGL